MAANISKSVILNLVGNSKSAEEAMAKVDAEADRLAEKHPELKIKIDSAAAQAKMALIRKELKDMNNEADNTPSKFNAIGQALNSLTLGVSKGYGEMSLLDKVIAGVGVSTGIAEPLLAGLTVAVGGLSSGLVSAGLGLGSFGLVAKSNLTVASSAATAVQNAQIAYNSAIAAGTKHATAYAAEQKAILTAYAQLSPAQIAMSKQIGDAQNAWQSFVQKNTSGVDAILTKGIGLIPKVFGQMQQFMAPTEKALGSIIGMISNGLSSSGFKSFMSEMAQSSGGMIKDLGVAVINLVKGIGGILKAFMPVSHEMMGGLDEITAKFAKWGETLSSHSGFQSMMQMFHQETPIVIHDLGQLVGIVKNVVAAMAGMTTFSNSTSLFKLAGPILSFANALTKAHPGLVEFIVYGKLVADVGKKLSPAFQAATGGVQALSNLSKGFRDAELAASDATGIWGTFGGKLSTATKAISEFGIGSKIAAAATKVWTGIQAAFDVVMDANPIILVVAAIALIVTAIVLLSMKSKAFRDFWKDVWHDILAIVMPVFDWIKTHWPLLVEILGGPIAIAVVQIVKHWDTIKHDAMAAWDFVVNVVKRAWNDIIGAIRTYIMTEYNIIHGAWEAIIHFLNSLGSDMFNIGRNIIMGLINGIENAAGWLISKVQGLANDVTGVFKSVLGIFSPSRVFFGHGQDIVRGLVMGIQQAIPTVHSAVGQLSAATSFRSAGVYGAAAAGGAGLQLEWIGGQADGEFMSWLKKNIRVRGGDPSVLGH